MNGTYRPNDPVSRGQMTAFLRRLSGEFEIAHTSVNPGSSGTFSGSATCPGDKPAIAGGGHTSNTNLFVTDSWPSGSSWFVRWESDNDVAQDPTAVEVWALCAPRL
jgi:hypothetical protein